MQKIAIFVGTRPDYLKLYSVYQAFKARDIRPVVVATGQHHDILKQQQDSLYMPLDDWLVAEQIHAPLDALHGAIYMLACDYLRANEPDAVFVNGDTTSSLAVGQAAFHRGIPVAHVEAGLRSYDFQSPYPEEYNRIALDALSSYLFCPTQEAGRRCRNINPKGRMCVTGNTVIDALRDGLRQIQNWVRTYSYGRYILLDLHRRETEDWQMDAIVQVVIDQAQAHGLKVVWPAHPSPRVQAVARSFEADGFIVLPPLDYLRFIEHMRDAELILTDSGGVVEEAITIGTPTLQLRDRTERPEALECQASWLATTDPDEIARHLKIAIPYTQTWKEWLTRIKNPYGDGHAGEKIVNFFLESQRS